MDDAEIKSTYYEKVGYDAVADDAYEPTYVYGDEYSLDNNIETIKNIAVSAAFRAAAAGTEVEMEQILNCLKEEMKKSGKNLQREDFGPYYSLMNREEDTSHAII